MATHVTDIEPLALDSGITDPVLRSNRDSKHHSGVKRELRQLMGPSASAMNEDSAEDTISPEPDQAKSGHSLRKAARERKESTPQEEFSASEKRTVNADAPVLEEFPPLEGFKPRRRCLFCKMMKRGCSGDDPCERCMVSGRECQPDEQYMQDQIDSLERKHARHKAKQVRELQKASRRAAAAKAGRHGKGSADGDGEAKKLPTMTHEELFARSFAASGSANPAAQMKSKADSTPVTRTRNATPPDTTLTTDNVSMPATVSPPSSPPLTSFAANSWYTQTPPLQNRVNTTMAPRSQTGKPEPGLTATATGSASAKPTAKDFAQVPQTSARAGNMDASTTEIQTNSDDTTPSSSGDSVVPEHSASARPLSQDNLPQTPTSGTASAESSKKLTGAAPKKGTLKAGKKNTAASSKAVSPKKKTPEPKAKAGGKDGDNKIATPRKRSKKKDQPKGIGPYGATPVQSSLLRNEISPDDSSNPDDNSQLKHSDEGSSDVSSPTNRQNRGVVAVSKPLLPDSFPNKELLGELGVDDAQDMALDIVEENAAEQGIPRRTLFARLEQGLSPVPGSPFQSDRELPNLLSPALARRRASTRLPDTPTPKPQGGDDVNPITAVTEQVAPAAKRKQTPIPEHVRFESPSPTTPPPRLSFSVMDFLDDTAEFPFHEVDSPLSTPHRSTSATEAFIAAVEARPNLTALYLPPDRLKGNKILVAQATNFGSEPESAYAHSHDESLRSLADPAELSTGPNTPGSSVPTKRHHPAPAAESAEKRMRTKSPDIQISHPQRLDADLDSQSPFHSSSKSLADRVTEAADLTNAPPDPGSKLTVAETRAIIMYAPGVDVTTYARMTPWEAISAESERYLFWFEEKFVTGPPYYVPSPGNNWARLRLDLPLPAAWDPILRPQADWPKGTRRE